MPHTSADWRPGAAAFLYANTRAARQVIQHFIDLHWDADDGDEENLLRFETYLAEFTGAFAS